MMDSDLLIIKILFFYFRESHRLKDENIQEILQLYSSKKD